jgi:hypothetical protein
MSESNYSESIYKTNQPTFVKNLPTTSNLTNYASGKTQKEMMIDSSKVPCRIPRIQLPNGRPIVTEEEAKEK